MHRAIWLELDESGQFYRDLRELGSELIRQQLPAGDVTVRVEFSTLNYKDALALTHHGPVVRQWPMVPGIDAAGVIERSFGIELKACFLSAQLFCDGRNALAKRPCDSNFIIGDGP